MSEVLQNKQRNAGLDLLKIMACLMVSAVHFLGNGILYKVEFGGFNTISARCFESLAIVCVNLFILISGYFGITSRGINIRRIINMLIMIAFYSVASYLYYSLKANEFSVPKLFVFLAPYLFEGYWFVRVYLMLVLLAPFLNLGLTKLNRKSYTVLIVISFILFSVLPSFNKAFAGFDGYDIVHFVFMYITGGYIRLHISKKPGVFLSLALYVAFAVFTFIFSIYGDNIGYWSYNFVTVIPETVFLFLAFEQMTFKNRFISFCAQSSLAVFVFENSIHNLYEDVFKVEKYMKTVYFIPHFFACILCFAVFAFGIDCLRRIIFKYSIDRLVDKISFANKRVLNELE